MDNSTKYTHNSKFSQSQGLTFLCQQEWKIHIKKSKSNHQNQAIKTPCYQQQFKSLRITTENPNSEADENRQQINSIKISLLMREGAFTDSKDEFSLKCIIKYDMICKQEERKKDCEDKEGELTTTEVV